MNKRFSFVRHIVVLLLLLVPIGASAGLVAKYSFEGNTQEGGTWQGTTGNYVTGVAGQAAAFDGIDDVLDLGGVYAIGTNDVSVAFWVRFEDGPPDQQMLSTGDQGQAGLIAITYANGGSQRVRLVTQEIVNGSHVGDNLYADGPYVQNVWYHIVVTRSGNIGNIYIDGELQNSESDLRAGDLGSGHWRLGLGHQGSYFEGAIDELQIFDHALDQDDVDDIVYPSQAIAQLRLKEDPIQVGEVIAVGKGFVVEPPAGQTVNFDTELTCPGFSATHTCSVDAAVNTETVTTANGVKMKCIYDTSKVVPVARVRLVSKNTVLEGDTCSYSVSATADGVLLLDSDATAVLHE